MAKSESNPLLCFVSHMPRPLCVLTDISLCSSFDVDLAVCLSCVDLSFVQFFGDDFLRILLLRYVFCYVTLRLHKAFRVSRSANIQYIHSYAQYAVICAQQIEIVLSHATVV